MSVRRVVTGEVGGRSAIIDDGPPPSTEIWEDLWIADPSDPLGRDPAGEQSFEPTAGACRWRLFSVPPDSVLRQMIASAGGAGEDPDAGFFHKTNTIDYVYVLDGGDLTLEMDDGDVLLHPGDVVVQRATNHAWRNRNDVPVRLLVVMTALP